MDTLFLLIIVVLLGLVLYNIEKLSIGQNPPPKYSPRKNSIMDKDSDMYALYYTDMLYPVYGREVILTAQRAYRNCTHKAFDLGLFGVRHASEVDKKKKKIEYLTQEMNRILLEKNLLIMMQANLDVLNGKITIEQARSQTVNTVDINNAFIPQLASRQIGIDIEAGVSREMFEYLDFNFLKAEEQKRLSKK